MIKIVYCLKKMKFNFYQTSCNKDEHWWLLGIWAHLSHCQVSATPVWDSWTVTTVWPGEQWEQVPPHGLGLSGCGASGRVSSVAQLVAPLFGVHIPLFTVHMGSIQTWRCSPVSSCCFSGGLHCLVCLFIQIWPFFMCPNQILQIINRMTF